MLHFFLTFFYRLFAYTTSTLSYESQSMATKKIKETKHIRYLEAQIEQEILST